MVPSQAQQTQKGKLAVTHDLAALSEGLRARHPICGIVHNVKKGETMPMGGQAHLLYYMRTVD